MEHRHRQVAHVVGTELHHVGQRAADPAEPALRAQARLGSARRARREQQQVQVGVGDLDVRESSASVMLERLGVRGGLDLEGAVRPDAGVDPIEERRVAPFGHQQLALGVGDVAGQLRAPPGRVDADDDRARDRRRAEPDGELRDVVEQDAHVERARPAQLLEQGGALRTRGHVLGVAPRPVLEQDGGVLVGGAGADELGDRRHRLTPR